MIDTSLFPALVSLLTVARAGSVGGAARQHALTPSAISQQIRRLESHFGVKLLERAGRGVRLSAVAEAALPAIAQLANEAETVFGHLAAFSGRPVVTLRIAVSDYLGKALLVPVLRELLDHRVPVRFEIVTTHSRDAVGRVLRGEVAFGVVSADRTPAGLESQTLFDQSYVWVAARRPHARRESLVARLAREPLLRLAAESQGRQLLDTFLHRERVRTFSTIDVTSVSLLLSYVDGGLGIGLVPAVALHDVPSRRIVVELADVPPTPVRLVSRPGAGRDPVASRFVAAVVAKGCGIAGRARRRR